MNTVLYQLELNQKLVDCGMSYVFHLKDNRFFILDGGYFTPGEEDRIYSFLCEKASTENPVIAGWFFSHAHQDHVGNFIQFLHKYSQQVSIEKLYYNFQPIDFSQVTGDWRTKCNDDATVQEFYRTLATVGKDIPVRILHTGDSFTVGEINAQVLYTQEELYPKRVSFNDYSTVLMTEIAGQKILWLGDAAEEASRILLTRKEALQCDIVQISHHGYNGATAELYQATKAKVALWPTPDFVMAENRGETENRVFIKDESLVVNQLILNELAIKEHFVSGEGTVALNLPYQIGTAIRYPKEFFHITE